MVQSFFKVKLLTLSVHRSGSGDDFEFGRTAQPAPDDGGQLALGQKVSERVAGMRTLPPGIDQGSASRHPDWTGPDDLRIKIEELREATGWEKPVYVKLGVTRVEHDVKLGATRVEHDVKLALGADAVSIGVGALVALGCNKPTYGRATRTWTPRRGTLPWAPCPGAVTSATPGCARWG